MERPAPLPIVGDHQPEGRRSPHAERSWPVSNVAEGREGDASGPLLVSALSTPSCWARNLTAPAGAFVMSSGQNPSIRSVAEALEGLEGHVTVLGDRVQARRPDDSANPGPGRPVAGQQLVVDRIHHTERRGYRCHRTEDLGLARARNSSRGLSRDATTPLGGGLLARLWPTMFSERLRAIRRETGAEVLEASPISRSDSAQGTVWRRICGTKGQVGTGSQSQLQVRR